MFTGLVEEIGTVEKIINNSTSAELCINCEKILEEIKIGDSICVNGICLTVKDFSSRSFSVDVMNETIKRSNLSNLKKNQNVNLERAMLNNGRFGGHIVTGHIDGYGRISYIKKDDIAVLFTIEASEKILNQIVEKGSVCVDGISLTVIEVTNKSFSVSIIPHTQKNTILENKKINDFVNIETDLIGKYLEKFFSVQNKKKEITMDFLNRCGF